jgi:hypothetical protein
MSELSLLVIFLCCGGQHTLIAEGEYINTVATHPGLLAGSRAVIPPQPSMNAAPQAYTPCHLRPCTTMTPKFTDSPDR